ncbi:hypothetical protein DFH09DRAFT_1319066 [Mycena vulgaris]|nr:hypothetical protein DFH09DRAFT_1319066 [Mycena vulgaris]
MPASSSFCGHCTGTAALRSMTLLPLSCCDVAAHDDTTIKANDIRWAARAPLSCEEHGYVRDWPRRLTAFTADSMSATSPARPTVTAIRGKPPPREHLDYDSMSIVIVSAGPRSTRPRWMRSTSCGYTGANEVRFSTEVSH